MGHRLDAGGVHGAHLFDEAEDAVELLLQRSNLRVRNFDPGEVGDAADFIEGQHAKNALRP